MIDDSVVIIAIAFPADGLVQIQYAEERDQSSAAAVQRSIMIDTQYLVDGELEELIEAAQTLVDTGLRLIRTPPTQRGLSVDSSIDPDGAPEQEPVDERSEM